MQSGTCERLCRRTEPANTEVNIKRRRKKRIKSKWVQQKLPTHESNYIKTQKLRLSSQPHAPKSEKRPETPDSCDSEKIEREQMARMEGMRILRGYYQTLADP